MNLLSHLRNRPQALGNDSLDFGDWVQYFDYAGLQYPLLQTTQGMVPQAQISPGLYGFSENAAKVNGVVYACIATKMRLFGEARFKFKPKRSVGTGDLFGGSGLGILEVPWPRASTSDLLSQISLHLDLTGNAYVHRENSGTLRLLRPDWTTILMGTSRPNGQIGDIGTEVAAYLYQPPGCDRQVFDAPTVAHIMPVPDPIFPWRGMSWLQPIVQEVMADGAMTTHKRKYFDNAATANMIVKLDVGDPDEFDKWVDRFESKHTGSRNAYRTLFLAGAADAQVVGANLKDVEFGATQAHGETRIAIAAGVPAIVLGITEGLDKSAYTDYAVARKHFADSRCGRCGGWCATSSRACWTRPAARLSFRLARCCGSRIVTSRGLLRIRRMRRRSCRCRRRRSRR